MAKHAVTSSVEIPADGTMARWDPTRILANDNARFGLKKTRLETLKEAILEFGEVHTAIDVEPIEGDPDHDFLVTAGHYRLEAVTQLNAEQGAGLDIPIVVHTNADPVMRLKRQLSENIERENLSPMDQAIAIKKALALGMSRMDVRNLFKRVGGRKGNVVQPASNSFINMTLSFLELPKAIQNKIHDGTVGVAAAYELTKVPIDKREEVLADAEKARLKVLDIEEKDEAKFLETEQKIKAAQEKAVVEKEALSKIEAEVEELAKAAADHVQKDVALYQTANLSTDADAKKAAEEALKASKAQGAELKKAVEAKRKELEKQNMKVEAVTKAAAERAKGLKAARGAATKAPTVKAGDIKTSAAKVGVATGPSPLTAAEMRKLISDLCIPNVFPIVAELAKVINAAFNREIDENQMLTRLAVITGEKKEAKGAAKKGKAA